MNIDQNGFLDIAVKIDYSKNSMSRLGYIPTHIVLHGTAGGVKAQDTANYFVSTIGGTEPVSAHFIIGQDGTIVQGISCLLAAYANGYIENPSIDWPLNINPNYYTISIEHCKPSTDNSDTLTEPQKKSSFELINTLCNTYHIAKIYGDVHGGIISHADFDTVNRKNCPGIYPWTDLFTSMKGDPSVAIPIGWTYDDNKKILIAPNKIQVTDGFAQWILNHSWDNSNLPLMVAAGVNPVEQGNKTLGPGTVQPFRTKILAWTPKMGVYEMWVGQEYMALYQLYSYFSSQNDHLQIQIKNLQSIINSSASIINAQSVSASLQSALTDIQTALKSVETTIQSSSNS